MKITYAPVLIVENDPNDVLLIRRAFRRAELDMPVQVVKSGEEAIDYLSGAPPFGERHLFPLPVMVVVDLKMPRVSGFEVITWVKAQPRLKRLPIVVLTSSRDAGDIERAYECGASSYLVKPVAFDALQMMLTTFGHYWLNFNTPPQLGELGTSQRTGHAT